jgi:hypothetical protein
MRVEKTNCTWIYYEKQSCIQRKSVGDPLGLSNHILKTDILCCELTLTVWIEDKNVWEHE